MKRFRYGPSTTSPHFTVSPSLRGCPLVLTPPTPPTPLLGQVEVVGGDDSSVRPPSPPLRNSSHLCSFRPGTRRLVCGGSLWGVSSARTLFSDPTLMWTHGEDPSSPKHLWRFPGETSTRHREPEGSGTTTLLVSFPNLIRSSTNDRVRPVGGVSQG